MIRQSMLALLRVYKTALSPVTQALGIHCRYEPSCSAYSSEAIQKHGGWFGGWMTLARLCRCHPFGGSGIDNVPDTVEAKLWTPWRAGVWRSANSD